MPARICWLGYGERDKAGLIFNDLVRSGKVKAPLVIGRDHLDSGSVASPNRETEGMRDGSDAIGDWPVLNALLNTASGASWVSFHHGGGVGIGYSLHAGMVVVADGTPEAERRLSLVLRNDPGTGVMRHVDAGYKRAAEVAGERASKFQCSRVVEIKSRASNIHTLQGSRISAFILQQAGAMMCVAQIQFLKGDLTLPLILRTILIVVTLCGAAAFAHARQQERQPPKPVEAEAKDPQQAAALFEAGQKAHEAGKLDEAVKLYGEALAPRSGAVAGGVSARHRLSLAQSSSGSARFDHTHQRTTRAVQRFAGIARYLGAGANHARRHRAGRKQIP